MFVCRNGADRMAVRYNNDKDNDANDDGIKLIEK